MESYQTLNRELVLTVRDLRKQNFDLRDQVNSLVSENITITSEFSDFKRRALDKFTKMSEIIGSVGVDLFDETPKRAAQPEVSKMRYSAVNSSGSLPRSSPGKKTPGKSGGFHVNVGRRRGGQRPREVGNTEEGTDLQDMSLENIQEWLRTDQIEVGVPTREEHKEAQPTEDTPQIQEEAVQEVAENLEGMYRNMTTIAEENSKSISHSSLLQVTKFASSTPHNNNNPFTDGARMDVSPIEFNKCDQRCLQTNFEKKERIFESRFAEVPEESPATPQVSKNVTVRRRERVIRDFSSGSTPERPLDTPKEPEKTPEGPKNVVVRRRERVKRDITPESTPGKSEETSKKPKETPEKPGRTPKEPEDTPEKPEETPKEPDQMTKKPKKTLEKPGKTPKEAGKTPREPEETPERPKKKAKTTRKKLADKTNVTENATEELPKLEDLDTIVEDRRPKRRAAPQNLAEPSLSIKIRRPY